jgi:hypothetical protein
MARNPGGTGSGQLRDQQAVDRVERTDARMLQISKRELDLEEDDKQECMGDVDAIARALIEERKDQDDRRY